MGLNFDFFDSLGFQDLFREFVLTLPEEERKDGGYFCLMEDQPSESPVVVVRLGNPPADKEDRYRNLCLEKAYRLQSRTDLTSWQSRDPDLDLWGGAIKTLGFIWSFSGLRELSDEAFAIKVVSLSPLARNPLVIEKLREMAKLSQNPFCGFLS